LRNNWETTYRVVAEIVDNYNYNKISNLYKYSRIKDGMYIVSINENLLERIDEEFYNLF